MKWRYRILIVLAVIAMGIWANNRSLFVDTSAHETRVLAHRGVHQTFSHEDLQNDTCTAERIFPVEHGFMENTIPSMKAAFDAGADIVELDVHLTPDGQLAVFHDWTVDCRTEGEGVTQDLDMAYLQTLDVGYGYTADGGETYPLRGTGLGLMPSLSDVLTAFPDGRFLVNYKSRRPEEGEALVSLLNTHPEWLSEVYGVYGGSEPTNFVRQSALNLPGYDRDSLLGCLVPYLLLGWSGYVPEACADAVVVVPGDLGWLLWGWPHRFTQRMKNAGSDVFLLGPYDGGFTNGVDSADQWDLIPEKFDGYVWTNRVEVMGAMIRPR